MEEYSGKRAVDGLVVPRKRSGLVLRDAAESKDTNAQFCNRRGCKGRLKHTKSEQSGLSEKSKSTRPPFQASSGKEIIGSSSGTCSVVPNTRKSFQVSQKKLSSQLETDSSETSSVRDGPVGSDVVSSPGRAQIGTESGKVRSIEVGSSSIASNSRPPKVFRPKSAIDSRDSPLGPAVPLASKSPCPGPRNSASASKYGLRNNRCNSTSDAVTSGCSLSESNLTRRKDMMKKRNPEIESSFSVRGKKTIGPLSEDNHSSTSTYGISISDSRRARNSSQSVGSVWTQRSVNGNNRASVSSNRKNGNRLSPTELHVVAPRPQVPQRELPVAVDVQSSSHQFSSEASSSRSTSFSHDDGLARYNMDGITEVLSTLERMEQDEEITYAELLALETNLLLGGFGFYDQHRDMRLDIDNMSYEQLLALEEKMGNVSTALSEEALLKCLKRSIYQTTTPEEGTMGCSEDGDEDDTKCSICQEEYAIGDEVGRLGCEHGFHMSCINQWLRLKNWCPICKTSAGPAPSSSPS
ncbi:unnamed protein product [Camellia sinensis]